MTESNTPKRNDGIYHTPNVKVEPFPALANSTMGGITAPVHPPHRFNDDTLMYVAVRVGARSKGTDDTKPSSKLKTKIKSFKTALSKNSSCTPTSSEDIRVIRMPRRDYIKYFARNEAEEYVGTEPEKTWSDEDLEEAFGRYRDFQPTKWVRKSEDKGGRGTSALVPGKEVFAAAEASEGGERGRLLNES